MPSARDLLQQADALMRSNRNVGASGAEEAVPVLTDVAVPGRSVQYTSLHSADIPVLTQVVGPQDPLIDMTIPVESAMHARVFPPTHVESLLPLSEMPEMPQVGDDDSIMALRRNESKIDHSAEPVTEIGDVPKWLEPDLLDGQSSPTMDRDALHYASAPVALQAPTPPRMEALGPVILSPPVPGNAADPIEPEADDASSTSFTASHSSAPKASAASPPAFMPATEDHPTGAPIPASLPAAETNPSGERVPSAEEVAETVYYQVLQNLDLYTERALQQHLTTHLAPIIERTTSELLATLNANLGALMRQYVAEAIEKQLGVLPVAHKLPRDT